MIRALLVDDEQPARERLRQLLAAHADVEVVGEAEDGVQAVEAIAERQPDVVFLDIQMPGASGLDVAASLGFFERAFGMKRRFLHESGGYGELETGTTTLSFAQHATARENLGRDYVAADRSPLPLGVEVGLLTDDVAAACERAKKIQP